MVPRWTLPLSPWKAIRFMKQDSSRDPLRDLLHYLRVFQSLIGARIYLVFALGVFAAVLESFGILMIIPLLRLLDGGPPVDATGASQFAASMLGRLGIGDSVLAILLLMAAIFLVRGLFLFLSNGYKSYLSAILARDIRVRLYDEYSQMRLQYYVSKNTGHFINVMLNQITQFAMAFEAVIALGRQLLMSAIYLGLALWVSWRFGLMALVLGLLLLLAFQHLNIYVRDLSRRASAESGTMSGLLIQGLQALKYLSATGQGPKLRTGIVKSLRRFTRMRIRVQLAEAFTGAVKEPLVVTAMIAILIIQVVLLGEPIAAILVSILLFYRALTNILGLQSNWQKALSTIGGVEMVRDEFLAQSRNREVGGERSLGPLSQGIELKDVSFFYGDPEVPVLRGLNLWIPAKTSVAVVGESGSGKSTLLDLLTLMLTPGEGEIFIDGVSAREVRLESWRSQIGFVSQDSVVFDDTVFNNICMWEGAGNRDPALVERVHEAARLAYISDVIEALVDGYDTKVGDRGVRLSGGQKQRLCLARELFKSPRVLILDEATSALDSESEKAIQRSIDGLKGRVTVIIVAHRLSSIRNVDKIFLLEKGKVAEEGSFEALRDDEGSRFSRLVAMQKL
jgi:ABC-type multidrug transport system fused ATPase/permease subunit